MFFFKGKPDLTSNKSKSSTEFKQECLQMINDLGFQICF